MTNTSTAVKAGSVSETAHWIAAYRAQETARPDALFRDPLAAKLAGQFGDSVPKGIPPWPMIVRTKLIDDLILSSVAEGVDCVLNLAAGLDTRPYRLPLPATLRWVEADFPAMVDAKNAALDGEKPVCQLTREPADLADDAVRGALLDRVTAGAKKVLVLTEGLLVYLPESAVRAMAKDLAARPNIRVWMIDIASPFVLRQMQKQTDAWLDERDRMKFAPENGVAYYEALGWPVRDVCSMFPAAVKWKRVPFWMRLFSLFPDANPRKPGNRPWGAVVRFER